MKKSIYAGALFLLVLASCSESPIAEDEALINSVRKNVNEVLEDTQSVKKSRIGNGDT